MKWIILFLEKLFCKHQWTTYKKMDIFVNDDTSKLPVKTRATLFCTQCGKIKQIIL